MHRKLLVGVVALVLSTVPVAAAAAAAYALNGAQIFAGPGNDYPVVAELSSGVSVNVNGCLSDYSWCDVNLGSNRGWAYAGDLAYPYQNRRVPILGNGPRLSLPRVTFSLGNYWDRYYRGKPFYEQRSQWAQRASERAKTEPGRATTENRSNVNRSNVTQANENRGKAAPANENRGKAAPANENRGNVTQANENRGKAAPANENRGKAAPANENRGKAAPANENRGKAAPANESRGESDDRAGKSNGGPANEKQ